MSEYKIRQFLELLYLLVQKELKVRYKSSVLGYLWALANPFAFALVYYIAFKIIMRVQMPNYSIFLLAGMFPWVWMSNSLIQATSSYKNNASLVKKVNLNRAVLPLSNVAHEMVHFFFALPVLAIFIKFAGGDFFLSWIWQIPLMLLLQLFLVYPIALILALANVYVHDVEYLIGIFLSLLFFMTPIVYPITMVPESYRIYFEWSPVYSLITNWRDVLLSGTLNPETYLLAGLMAFTLGGLAAIFYRKASVRMGELL
jgi:lipopolysaccharide transport system permease protein